MKNLIFSLTLALLFPLSVSAIEYGGIGGRPAYPNAEIERSEDIFIHTLKPGEVKQEGVNVINNTAEEKYLLVYATDYVPSSGGGFACRQFLENKESVGQWIKMNKSLVKLPAYSQSTVNFLIEVPEKTSPGEHNGCIAIQEYKPNPTGETGVTLATRTAIRVAITIPGKIIQNLEILGLKQTINENGFINLNPSIKNSGNISIDTEIKVKTYNTFGNKIREQGGEYSILQDSTLELNFEIPRPLFGGIYHSILNVDYLHDKKISSKTILYIVYPSKIGLLILGPIIFLIIILILTKIIARKRRIWIEKNWVQYKVKSGETITSIAEKKNVSWKLLAKVNSIKAPYELTTKMTLLAPNINEPKPKAKAKTK